MKQLHFPAAEHAAAKWYEEPGRISKALVVLYYGSPPFNYRPMYSAIRDLLILNVPYDQIVEGIRKTKLPVAKKSFLEILPLVKSHFDGIQPDFVNSVSERRYPIAPGLSIPIRPPLIYGLSGEVVMPWPIFWKNQSLKDDRLSLFASIVQDVMTQDPFFDDVKFEVHFYSAVKGSSKRSFTIVPGTDIAPMSEDRRIQMLRDLATGYQLAKAEIEMRTASSTTGPRERGTNPDPNQPSFFD